MKDFLPISPKEMEARGWEEYDFLFVSGDAYVDHPSFGCALLSRLLEANGYKVAILAQPDWHSAKDFAAFPRPRLGVLISGGIVDSMVNHYTASKKRRSGDAYSPGGVAGRRPDRCVIAYSGRAREAFGNIPIIVGGTEPSLRRMAHYDYWQDKIRRSMLIDSGADLLSFGMGEKSILEIADALNAGIPVKEITWVKGTCYVADAPPEGTFMLPSYEEVCADKKAYAKSVGLHYEEQNPFREYPLGQMHGKKCVVENPPAEPLSTSEMDRVYALPFRREYHPSYEPMGGVPAIEEVKFSVTSCRGCYGACSFCALTLHQGRIIQSRSHASILQEAKNMTFDPDFKGYIHDVGGPTANFRAPACEKQLKVGPCKKKQCLFPKPCPNLKVDHSDYLKLLRALRALPGVKKVFVRSGIRYDYLLEDKDDTFMRELIAHHVSGQLKVAPEHISDPVLQKMGKPKEEVFQRFCDRFYTITKEVGKEQYLVPYLMSSHPGSTLKDAVNLAVYLKKHHIHPEQVQDFYPTPGTLSTAMFYSGYDPRTMEKVYVPRDPHTKALQRALLQFSNPKNYDLVYEALQKAGRSDLIGFDEKCLIRPKRERNDQYGKNTKRQGSFRTNQRRTAGKSSRNEKRGNGAGSRGYHRGR